MNNKIRILCYGDSNTWGKVPAQEGERYPSTVRWTGLLQKQLGDTYEVIEEGLGGRTTVIDDDKKPGRNGKTYLEEWLETNSPIDIIILWLGTNDLKERYDRTPEQIGEGVEELLILIQEKARTPDKKVPTIHLLSPPLVEESIPGIAEEQYAGADEKIVELASIYKQLAEKYETEFIDLASVVKPSKEDGLHLDPESHRVIAELLIDKIG